MMAEQRSAYTQSSGMFVRPMKNVLVILLGTLLLQHSCEALYDDYGGFGQVPAEDIKELTYRLVTEFPIDNSIVYTPGVVQQVVVSGVSGFRYVIQLVVFHRETCTLGYGSENLGLPPGFTSGAELGVSFNTRIFPALAKGLMYGRFGWAYAIDGAVLLSYFLLDDSTLPDDPDNDGTRRNQLMEILTDSNAVVPLTHVGLGPQESLDLNGSLLGNGSLQYPWTRTLEGDCRLLSALYTSNDNYTLSGALHILRTNYTLYSPNGMFSLVMQDDCNLVIYNDFDGHGPMFTSPTRHMGQNCYAKIGLHGVFGEYSDDDRNLWYTSNSRCDADACWSTVTLQLQDDGNLVLYANDEQNHSIIPLWSSATAICNLGCSRN